MARHYSSSHEETLYAEILPESSASAPVAALVLDIDRTPYSVDEFVRITGASRTAVYDAIAAGDFPIKPIRIGRRIMLPKQAVDRLLAGE